MQVLIFKDYAEVSKEAARFIARRLILKPNLVVALPTGQTPLGMYQELVRLHKEQLLDFSKAITFNLDEFLGISPEHPQSFFAYMRRHFWDYVNVAKENVHIPDSLAKDPEQECKRYEQLIKDSGGIDLAILGLGENGHIAFNEPGTAFESVTHVALLADETRERLAPAFGGFNNVPTHAITMGIKTIMHAREILLIATGENKRKALFRALNGPISPEFPASVLQLHPALTVVTDQACTSLLRAK